MLLTVMPGRFILALSPGPKGGGGDPEGPGDKTRFILDRFVK